VLIRWFRTVSLAAALTCGLEIATAPAARAADKFACVDAHVRAQELRQASRLRESREQLVVCADETCPDLVRVDCAGWLSQIERRLAQIRIEAKDSDGRRLTAVRVMLDGMPLLEDLQKPIVRIDPGEHQLRFERSGSIPVEKRVTLREGEVVRVSVTSYVEEAAHDADRITGVAPPVASGDRAPPEESSGHKLSGAAMVTGAATALALASAAFFGIRGLLGASQLRGECGSACDPARVAPIRTQLLVADVSLVTALALGGVTAWLVWRGYRKGNDATPSGLAAYADGSSMRLQYAVRF
jgi:hypothetical protein